MNTFELKILELHWISDTDQEKDLCAHGRVFVRIGNEIIANKDTFKLTLSSTALYLLRSLYSDYDCEKNGYGNQLLPCCGHFMFQAEKGIDFVVITGCPYGIDWKIIHTTDNKIKHISEKGTEAIIEFEEYRKIVFDFADEVEVFYLKSEPKTLPKDDFEKDGYLTFWREWKELRNRLN
ncbi:hypothetical protein WAF17_18960 [Bernardetia sp. ABR2-2B]|uniref:hypothetical protein n=1 Tax=Bernardetia sp. ABR2-2B TaxID=3127472 RepID=UPI0030CB4AD5